jgi:hypothetical protein
MAKQNTIDETVTDEVTVEPTEQELSDKAAAVREAIANRPRQSVTRFVEYFNIISELEPDRLEEFFGDQVPVLAEVADQVKNPVIEFRTKSDIAQLELAVNALTNQDEKNGYANYQFDAELFAEKTRPKTGRKVRTIEQKVEDLFSKISEEDQAALAELLKARGL